MHTTVLALKYAQYYAIKTAQLCVLNYVLCIFVCLIVCNYEF